MKFQLFVIYIKLLLLVICNLNYFLNYKLHSLHFIFYLPTSTTVETPKSVPGFVSHCAILDGKYFTMMERDGVKIKAINSCVTKTLISGSVNALSNFTTHLKVYTFQCQFLSLSNVFVKGV